MSVLSKDEFFKVTGEIYKITNNITKKCYIGQTRSHRLNKGKYRPFGFMGRFRDHISKSISNKTNTCRYLNYSILKYGAANFVCEKICTCPVQELDEKEVMFIQLHNSKYPNGYNLTSGGQGQGFKKKVSSVNFSLSENNSKEGKRVAIRNHSRAKETKSKISENVKLAINTPDHLKHMMELTQCQHIKRKFEECKDVTVDETNPRKHLSVITNNKLNYQYVRLSFGKKRITFCGKHEDIHVTEQRAINFINELITKQHNQIAGNSLEPSLPLPDSNISEELG
jgi:group I intron endonuclease